MLEKKDKSKHSTLSDALIGLSTVGVAVGIMGNILGGMNKMFGESNSIPKGVVKELIEGVMDGLMGHFESKIYDLKSEIEKLNKTNNELELQVEDLDRVKKGLDELHVKNINLNK